jgi:hypothetical protein
MLTGSMTHFFNPKILDEPWNMLGEREFLISEFYLVSCN